MLSVGSNLGDRCAWLSVALRVFGAAVVARSRIFETPPWGDPDQPAYLNAVLLVRDHSVTDPGEWLRRCHLAEAAAGRVRDPRRRFGPRTLDVDLISVSSAMGEPLTSTSDALLLPHPRAHLRAFVLRPWLDVEPDAVLVGRGAVRDLLSSPGLRADLEMVTPRDDLHFAVTDRA